MAPSIESPRLGGCGLLHIHSPTHPDPTSAIRSLRRSLSRSPSKPPSFRLVPSKSPSPSPSRRSPADLAPASPRMGSVSPQPSSPLAVSLQPGARSNRTSVRKTYSMRSRTSPAAPARRPLLMSRDHGNAAPASPAPTRGRPGKRETRSLSPLDGLGVDVESRAETMHAVDDRSAAPTPELPIPARALPITSSPLKRTESVVNLDRASVGSPVAKRRSLHAAVFGPDFNIFEQAMAAAIAAEPAAEQREGSAATVVTSSVHPGDDHPPSPAAPLPRRASSLRRSTLQQRHQERPTYALAKPNPDLALERAAHATAFQSKPKPHRVSLDNFLQPMPRDSPFAAAAPLPSASAHLMPGVTGAGVVGPARHGASQRHPLSQAISQSSSSSSVAEDSPTCALGRPDQLSHQVHGFARSLPLGALRPTRRGPPRPEATGQDPSADLAYATPPNYRLIKPLPAAFMSTGLISKRNRDQTRPVTGAGQRAVMPDTPCKKPTFSFQAGPLPPANRRATTTTNVIAPPASHDFGSPSTPLSVYRPRLRAGTGVGIFGAKLNPQRLSRSASFMSSDGDDQSRSPIDSQPGDFELPPTPTKPGLSPRVTPRSQGAVDVAIFGTNDDAGDSDASSLGLGPGPGPGSSREMRPCKRPHVASHNTLPRLLRPRPVRSG